VKVVNGSFVLRLHANEVYTLSTVADGKKGSYGVPPKSSPFPVPYVETFQSNFSSSFVCSLFYKHHEVKQELLVFTGTGTWRFFVIRERLLSFLVILCILQKWHVFCVMF